jgi:hypothetical protein
LFTWFPMSPWGADYIFILVALGQTWPRADCASSGATNQLAMKRRCDRRQQYRTARDQDPWIGSDCAAVHKGCPPTRGSFEAHPDLHDSFARIERRTELTRRAAYRPPHQTSPSRRQGAPRSSRSLASLPGLRLRSPGSRTSWTYPRDTFTLFVLVLRSGL